MDELPSFGLNLDEATWCEGCQRRQQVIDEHEKEKALNYKTLKQKIVSTDLLIKKFRSKCEEYDQQSKMLEDVTRKLERAKRETETLDSQLKNALQQFEPLKLENNALKTAMIKKDSEIEILQIKINAADKMRVQFEAFGQDTDKLKSKAERLEKEKKTFEKKIENAETAKSKLEKELLSSKDTIKTLKQEKKTLEKKLDKAHQIQEKHFERLQENNLLTKYDKRIRNSFVKQQQMSDDEDDFMLVEEIPFNPIVQVEGHKLCSVMDSMVTMSPLTLPMSPLPPTPQPTDRDDSDIDALNEILETELTQFDSSHLSSDSESEEVSDCKATVCDPQCVIEIDINNINEESVNENNNATIGLKPGLSMENTVVPNKELKTDKLPMQTAVCDETIEDDGKQKYSSTSSDLPVELNVHSSLEQPDIKVFSTVQDTINSEKSNENSPKNLKTVGTENKTVSIYKFLSDQTPIFNGNQLKHEVGKTADSEVGSTPKDKIIKISSFSPLRPADVESATQIIHDKEDPTSINIEQTCLKVVTDNDIPFDLIPSQQHMTVIDTVQEDSTFKETVEIEKEVTIDVVDKERYKADVKPSEDPVSEVLDVDETLDSLIDDKALIEFVPNEPKSFDPLNEVIVIDDEDTPIKIEPVDEQTISQKSSSVDLHIVEKIETSDIRPWSIHKEASEKLSEKKAKNTTIDIDKSNTISHTKSSLRNESNEHQTDSNSMVVMEIPRQKDCCPSIIPPGVKANCDKNPELKNTADHLIITKPDSKDLSLNKSTIFNAMANHPDVNQLCTKNKSVGDKSSWFKPIKMEPPICVSLLGFGSELEAPKSSDSVAGITKTMDLVQTEASETQRNKLENVPKKKCSNAENPSLFSPINIEPVETLSDLAEGCEIKPHVKIDPNEMDNSLIIQQNTVFNKFHLTQEAKDSCLNDEVKLENMLIVGDKHYTSEVKSDETEMVSSSGENFLSDLKTSTAILDTSEISHIVNHDSLQKHLSESSINSDQKSGSELELITAEFTSMKRQKKKAKKRKRKEEKRLLQSESVTIPTFSDPHNDSSSFKPIIMSQRSTGFLVSNSLDDSQPSCSKSTYSSVDILDIIFNSSDFLPKLNSDTPAPKSPFHLTDYFRPISPLPPSPEPLLFLEEESCLTTFDSVKIDNPKQKKLKLESSSNTITSEIEKVKEQSNQLLSRDLVKTEEKISFKNFKPPKLQKKRKSLDADNILPVEHINEDASDQLLGKKARISHCTTTNGTSVIRKTQLIPPIVFKTVPASKPTTSQTSDEIGSSKSNEKQIVLRRSRRTKDKEIKMENSGDKDISNIEKISVEIKKEIVPNVLAAEETIPNLKAESSKVKIELQAPGVNKFIPNCEEMEKDLDSFMKSGVEELDIFLEKYFKNHQLPRWFQLVQIILNTLKRTKTSLHPEICKNSQNPVFQPVLLDSETNLLVLLQNIFSKNLMCSDTIMLNMLLNSVISEDGTGQSKAAMCRIFTGLCRLKGDLEQARVLAYEVIFHLCVSNHIDGCTLVLAIAGVWPLIFDAKFPANNVMTSVMEHVVMNMCAEHRYSQTKNFASLSELCQWRLVLPADNGKVVCENIIKYLKIITGSDPENNKTVFKGNVFEGVVALKLLFKKEDFNFFYIHFVNRFLSSASQKWAWTAENGDLTPQYLQSMLRVVCEIDLVEKNPEMSRINSMVKNYLMPVLNKQSAFKIVSYTAAEAMMKLSPFSPQCICSFLQFWYRKHTDEIPEDIKTKLRQTRKYLLDNFTNFNCAEFV